MSSSKLTKVETQVLLEHAISIEGSNKAVARLIGVEPSRVSEGRHGRWHLTNAHRDILREAHGSPMPVEGEYHQVILVNDVNDELLDRVMADRQIQEIAKWQRSSAFQEHFLEHFECLNENIERGDDNAAPTKRMAVDDFLNSEEMESWLLKADPLALRPVDNFESIKALLYRDHCMTEALRKFKLKFNEALNLEYPSVIGYLFSSIFLLLKQQSAFQSTIGQHALNYKQSGYCLPAKFTLSDPGPRKSSFNRLEAVVTGKKVFVRDYTTSLEYVIEKSYDGLLNEKKIGVPAEKVFHNANRNAIKDFIGFNLPWQCTYEYAEITAYLSKKMNYHILVTLSGHIDTQGVRDKFAILGISASEVYGYISALDKWITGSKSRLCPEDIKWDIAKNGGLIRGATYIE